MENEEQVKELAQWLRGTYAKSGGRSVSLNDMKSTTEPWLLTARELQKKFYEELSKEVYDLYHQLQKGNVWAVGNDEVCDLCEERVIEILKSHFLKGEDK